MSPPVAQLRAAGRRRWKLALAVNLGAAILSVAAWVAWRNMQLAGVVDTHLEGTVTQGYYTAVDDVGYLPKPSRRITARRVTNGRVEFDVAYTIGPDRFRVVPGNAPDSVEGAPRACVLLFGDSNTFGEGVNDDETYAARLAKRGGGSYEVHDFGISGWGPHEMLAGLQSGRFRSALGCVPTHAVYFFITDHFRRITGFAPWEIHSPRYRLGADGRPVRDGNFDSDGPPNLTPPDTDPWGWRRLLRRPVLATPEQAALMPALLIEAAREVKALAPQARFDVIYWTEEDTDLLDGIAAKLRAAGIGVHPVERIVPGYREHWRDYLLSEVDRHPTPATHRLIADYIARQIVKR